MLYQLFVSVAIGALCGFVANKIMKGDTQSILWNAILGIIGGLVGGFLGHLIGIGGGWVSSILLAIAGSCLVVWIVRKIAK